MQDCVTIKLSLQRKRKTSIHAVLCLITGICFCFQFQLLNNTTLQNKYYSMYKGTYISYTTFTVGPGIESRWRRDFLHTPRPALRPTKPPVQWVPSLSRG
jgi:hypothetical protein